MSKKKSYKKENPQMKENLLPTPDKSADPPQPQGKLEGRGNKKM